MPILLRDQKTSPCNGMPFACHRSHHVSESDKQSSKDFMIDIRNIRTSGEIYPWSRPVFTLIATVCDLRITSYTYPAGSDEVLLSMPPASKKAQNAGVSVTLQVGERMQHLAVHRRFYPKPGEPQQNWRIRRRCILSFGSAREE
jgi:hypothetical protein